MRGNNRDVCEAYVSGNYEEGEGSNLFFNRDTIYSYGTHFPMAIRMKTPYKGEYVQWFLVNGDTYSNTTSKHQSYLRGALSGKRYVIIPFSALNSAGIDYGTIELIDQEPDRIVHTGRMSWRNKWVNGQIKKVKEEVTFHLMGASLIKADRQYWKEELVSEGEPYSRTRYGRDGSTQRYRSTPVTEKGQLYLSGLDETATQPQRSFFLSQLNKDIMDDFIGELTVADAYTSLMPYEVREAVRRGDTVQRQGEWFFVPAPAPTAKVLDKMVRQKDDLIRKNGFINNRDEDRTPRHFASYLYEADGEVLAKGYVTHSAKEHRRLSLKTWHYVYENTAVNSWSASGSVD